MRADQVVNGEPELPMGAKENLESPGLRRLLRLSAHLLKIPVAVIVENRAGIHPSFAVILEESDPARASLLEAELARSAQFAELHTRLLDSAAPIHIGDWRSHGDHSETQTVLSEVGALLGVALSPPGPDLRGSVWALSPEPRSWTQEEVDHLRELAACLASDLSLRQDLDHLREIRQDLRALGNARWLVWYAEVQDVGLPRLRWKSYLADEEAGQGFLSLDLANYSSYAEAWYHSRLPEDRALTDARGEVHVRQGKSYRQEYRCRDQLGIVHHLREEVEVHPVGPGFWRLVGITTDITERKQAEERATAFQTLGERLNLTTTPREAAEIIFEVADQLLGWDACWLDLCDFETRQSQSVLIMDLVEGERREVPSTQDVVTEQGLAWRAAHEGAFRILRTPESLPQPPEELVSFGDRTRTSASLLCAPIRYGNRTFGALSVQSYAFDAYSEAELDTLQALADYCSGALQRTMAETERRNLQSQLLQSQKMEAIGRLAGGVAHDFNNMLAVINGYAELLLMRLGSDTPDRSPVEEILKAGQRAASLTRQLLAFSRKQMTAPQVMDLAEAVMQTQKMLRRLIGEDIDLIALPEPGIGPIVADPAQIDQILVNLSVNARDAMPGGGKLTIRVSGAHYSRYHVGEPDVVPPGSYVRLEVSDTGCGIPPDLISQVFEPFFTTKAVGQGSGLGLATVHGSLKQNGGYIQVESVPSQGTAFRLYFPELRESAATVVDTRQVSSPSGTETLLLVEDEEMLRRLLKSYLEDNGYTVLHAAHGEAAIRICRQYGEQIQLLLTDVIMPVMGGRELVDWVRAHHPRMHVMYMSGYTEDAILRHGVRTDQAHFIQKPFTTAALALRIREVLDSSRPD